MPPDHIDIAFQINSDIIRHLLNQYLDRQRGINLDPPIAMTPMTSDEV